MPRKMTFGTNAFVGLNTKRAPQLLGDSELQEAVNCKFEPDGSVRPLSEDLIIYSRNGASFNGSNGMAAVKYGGADHLVYKPPFPLYQDNTALPALSNNSNYARFLYDPSRLYVFDGAENEVTNGTWVRKHGPLEQEDASLWGVTASFGDGLLISGATKADPVVVTTSTNHGLTSGDFVGIFGVVNMTEINDAVYSVTVLSPTTFSLQDEDSGEDVDGTAWGTWSGGGSVVRNPCRCSGAYKYAVSTVIEMSDGQIIESGLTEILNLSVTPSDRSPLSLSVYNSVEFDAYEIAQAEIDAYTDDSGATVSLRIYRTKAGGSAYYLHSEHTGSGIIGSAKFDAGYDTSRDSDLGALYLDSIDDHSAPPTSNLAVFGGLRMYLAVDNKLYWSMVGNYDYFPPLAYVETHDTITALGVIDDRIVIFGRDSIWIYVPDELLGTLMRSHSPVGTTYPDSVKVTDEGVYFARDDGLWLFDGVTSRRVNEQVEAEWGDLSGTWVGDLTTKRILYSTGSGMMTAERGSSGAMWTEVTSTGIPESVVRSLDSDKLYGFVPRSNLSGSDIVEMFAGSGERTMTIKTKSWGGGAIFKPWACLLDMDPNGNSVTVTVETSSGDTFTYAVTGDDRRSYRYLLPTSLCGEYWSVKVQGKCRVYGIRLEVLV